LLPNLVVIGAGKCGTTSLHSYLALHPQISMTRQKELKFFTHDDWRRRVSWYEAQFEPGEVRGESSPNYTMFPFESSAAERIAELIPDTRLIYLVRDPIERAIASYVELCALNIESRSIADALGDLDDPGNPHLCASRYATQLNRYLRCFDRERILVLDQADLLRAREATLAETFRFLGVDPGFESPEFARTHNTRETKVRYGTLGHWLVRHGLFTQRRGQLRRGPLIRPLRAILGRRIDSTLPDQTRERLVAGLAPEVAWLREFTGRSFPSWPYFPTDNRAASSDPRAAAAPPRRPPASASS
jgi:hypothetical protein